MQFETEQECFEHLDQIDKKIYKGDKGCNGTYDQILCFEATRAGETLRLPCPQMTGVFDMAKTLLKTCLKSGEWEGTNITGLHSGHTDYKVCLNEVSLKQAYVQQDSKYYELIMNIVLVEELIGIILSILCLLFSLVIFFTHSSLRCKRTKIHLNLFLTILLQSVFRLGFYIDRFLFEPEEAKNLSYSSSMQQYNNNLCPIGMSFLEYFQSCTFMWMLCEGVYLNVLLTYSIFDNSNQALIAALYFIGWILPAITVTTWFVAMYNVMGFDEVCWFGYYEHKLYWIIQGPILLALIVNVFCLFNVIRILTIKLRESTSNDSINQIKKSFKAAALLLPLLGVTHLFEMYHGQPINWFYNLVYSVVNCFLVFYNGVFLSILYCFMNNEVKNVLRRKWLSKFTGSKFFGSYIRAGQDVNSADYRITGQNRPEQMGETELLQMNDARKRDFLSNAISGVDTETVFI